MGAVSCHDTETTFWGAGGGGGGGGGGEGAFAHPLNLGTPDREQN